jgi:hypothetical protein
MPLMHLDASTACMQSMHRPILERVSRTQLKPLYDKAFSPSHMHVQRGMCVRCMRMRAASHGTHLHGPKPYERCTHARRFASQHTRLRELCASRTRPGRQRPRCMWRNFRHAVHDVATLRHALLDAGRVAKRRPCKSPNRSLHHVRARTGRIDDAPSRTRLARDRSTSGRCTRRFEDDARRPNPCGRHASHLRIDRRRRAPTRCASTRLTHARAECVAGPARASGHR